MKITPVILTDGSGTRLWPLSREYYHKKSYPLRIEDALLQHAAAAYNFWSNSLRAYREATPHDGYVILEKLCASRQPGNTCVYTSNVDGLFRRFPTLRAQLHEIHGCVEEWACSAALGYVHDVHDETTGFKSRGGIFEPHNAAVAEAARRLDGDDDDRRHPDGLR